MKNVDQNHRFYTLIKSNVVGMDKNHIVVSRKYRSGAEIKGNEEIDFGFFPSSFTKDSLYSWLLVLTIMRGETDAVFFLLIYCIQNNENAYCTHSKNVFTGQYKSLLRLWLITGRGWLPSFFFPPFRKKSTLIPILTVVSWSITKQRERIGKKKDPTNTSHQYNNNSNSRV